jgi:hypothetical protein
MYFEKFPKTFYSLDDRTSIQLVTNILLRVVVSEELRNNYSVFDEYDILEGETPEILAYKLYGDANLHWIILHFNEVIDPRFDWLLYYWQLQKLVENKYKDGNAVHHYEDGNGNIINGNVVIRSSTFDVFPVGGAVINESVTGTGYITSKPLANTIIVTTSTGGFQTNNEIRLATNNATTVKITSTELLSGIPVTNYEYENEINEAKRRIKVIKPQFVQRIVQEFEAKLAESNV